MKKHKSIYQDNGPSITIILFALSLLMIGFSIYLTLHYFELKFLTSLEGKSLCNVNQFFNCDKTTFSNISSFFGIPISLFGALIGIMVLLGLLVKSKDYERTVYFALIVNFVGCVFLLGYSLLILKGLCPFCSLYYLVSGITLFLFYKKSSAFIPSVGYILGITLVGLLVSGFTKNQIAEKTKAQSIIAIDVMKQFDSLPKLDAPKMISEFKIADGPNAPIKLIIFSDFECPTCKVFSQEIPKIVNRYQGKIDIQYFFYPLDERCNANLKKTIHPFACKAAYAVSCMPRNQFITLHDNFFLNQEKFSSGFLDQFIKSNNLESCVADPKTRKDILAVSAAGAPYNLSVTPSYLINGVKIEGVIPIEQLFAIFDEILRRAY